MTERTRKLAAANDIGTSDLRELSYPSDGNMIVNLRRCLEAQRKIYRNAA